MNEIRVLSPTGNLGYGFPRELLAVAMARKPHVIAVDGGSTDGGPYYLGYEPGVGPPRDGAFKEFIARDLEPLICAARAANIPLIVGSAGFAGGDLHLAGTLSIAMEIAQRNGLTFQLATIRAEVDKPYLLEKFRAGAMSPCGAAPPLTETDILESVRIVGQMGVEPFVSALNQNADVILAGRANDPSMFAALPWQQGFDRGLALHMAKILECGAIAADPGSGSDMLLGTLRKDHFVVEPIHPDRRCTVQSVAAHSLYEKSDPTTIYGPGGRVELSDVRFEQRTERSVSVYGSRFVESDDYEIKLEGAARTGFRAISIAGIRDPSVIAHLDVLLTQARLQASRSYPTLASGEAKVIFHRYGMDAVMGVLEPTPQLHPHEIGLVIECIAETQALATAIVGTVRSALLHMGFSGRMSTAGNLAFPFSPQDIPTGPVYRFSVYHLMRESNPARIFPVSSFPVSAS